MVKHRPHHPGFAVGWRKPCNQGKTNGVGSGPTRPRPDTPPTTKRHHSANAVAPLPPQLPLCDQLAGHRSEQLTDIGALSTDKTARRDVGVATGDAGTLRIAQRILSPKKQPTKRSRAE